MSEVPPESNYYRPPTVEATPLGPELGFADIATAWKVVSSNLPMWAVISLLYFCTGGMVSVVLSTIARYIAVGDFMPRQQLTLQYMIHLQLVNLPFGIVSNAFITVIIAGMQYTALSVLRGQPLDIGNFFYGFKYFGRVFIFGLVFSTLVTLGTLMCIFPGIYAVGVLSLGPLLIVDRQMGEYSAMAESSKLLGSKAWLAGFVLLVGGIVSALGVCACGVGIFVTLPLAVIVPAVFYHRVFPPTVQTSAPLPFQLGL